MKKFLLTSLFIFSIYASLFAGKAYAAKPIPPEGRIPCQTGQTQDPNFSSDRPYQASPCGDSPKALMCGNTVEIQVSTPSETRDGNVAFISGNPLFTLPQKTYIFDVSGAQLPILGNTELTKNSQNATDQIDDPTKLNEYVSWYLNGVNNKAENGASKNTDNETVNLSGPIQKLLPSVIQDSRRLATIQSETQSVTYVDDTKLDTGSNPSEAKTTDIQNHNQIVVCANVEPFLGPIGWLFGLVQTAIPHDCYKGDGSSSTGKTYRLDDWLTGDLGGERTITNDISSSVINIFKLVPGINQSSFVQSFRTAWNKKFPPLPWSDENGKPFPDSLSYQKAYNEWRGETCGVIPVLNKLICFPNPLWASPEWSELYPYVPLSNTVDKNAKNWIYSVPIQGEAGTIISPLNVQYVVNNDPVLMFAHSQEDSDLSTLLNKTYVPKTGTTDTAPTTDVEPVNDPTTGQCRILNLRSNPGDNLFAEVKPSEINVLVNPITVLQVPCHQVTSLNCDETQQEMLATGVPKNCHQVTESICQGTVSIKIQMITKVPYANEIFDSTVAGADSTFRKIYPKVGNNAPITCIADIPTDTGVTYTAVSGVGQGDFKVLGPSGDNTTANPKLYFPHYGSVYDYFLKGIQQALRPQGYGEGTPQSGQLCNNISCGELPTGLPKASGSCSLGGVSSKVGNIPASLKQIIEAASQTYGTPPNLILGIMYGEGLFNPGRFNWSDANVKNWATCQKVPGCNESGDDNFMGFNGSDFTNIAPHILPDLQKLDPTKKTLSQCNLLDAIYAEAYNLHASAAGGGGLPPSCYGIPLHSTIPSSCSWNDSQYENAIKVSETGYTKACLTLPGSCATGGGLAATCPGGDNCEQVGGSGNTSHNACVWDVGHGN